VALIPLVEGEPDGPVGSAAELTILERPLKADDAPLILVDGALGELEVGIATSEA